MDEALKLARVFGLPVADVTKAQRNQAKMVNYGISYGISAFGLSQRLGIPLSRIKASEVTLKLPGGATARVHQFPNVSRYIVSGTLGSVRMVSG